MPGGGGWGNKQAPMVYIENPRGLRIGRERMPRFGLNSSPAVRTDYNVESHVTQSFTATN